MDIPSELYLAMIEYLKKRGWKIYSWKNLRLMCEAPPGVELLGEGQTCCHLEHAIAREFVLNRDAWNKMENAYLHVTNLPELKD